MPVTGAPIYLVSACTSGEEFVAAFRRYADKHGLFVPIKEPLAAGRRCRLAVTLKDGGVMIEGEAEIVSSARTASVLHGRAGMTLRFLEPDDASKTMLRDLEKARLSMRPAPPTMSPRPAEIPAEPRPVPPPVQGRIDAANALAECVAIGDTDAPAPTAPIAPVVPPPKKAGPRFVAPMVPAVPAIPAAPTALGLGAAASLRPPTAPQPIASAKTDERKTSIPPSIAPRAPLQPEQPHNGLEQRSDPEPAPLSISGFSKTMTAVAPILDPGPTSDTFVAVAPPEPPAPTPPAATLRAARPTSETFVAVAPPEPPAPTPTAATLPAARPTSETFVAVAPPEPPAPTPTAATLPAARPIAATPPAALSTAPTPTVATPPAALFTTSTPTAATPPAALFTTSTPTAATPPAALFTTSTPTAATPPAATPVAPRRAVEMPAAIPRPITKPQPAEVRPRRTPSDTLTAVPIPGTTSPSAPTDIGGVLVDLQPPTDSVVSAVLQDDLSGRTQVHAGVPPRDPPAVPARDVPPAPIDGLAGRPPTRAEIATTQRGPALARAQPQPQPSRPPEAPEPKQKLALEPELEIDDGAPADSEAALARGGATHIGMPPIPRGTAPASPLAAVPRPAPPIVAPERPAIPEVEIAEPTDLSLGPPEPPEPVLEPPSQEAVAPEPPEPVTRQQRKTVIGVVIPPSGVSVLPASAPATASDAGDAGDASLQAAGESTGAARVVAVDLAVDITAPAAPPEPQLPPAVEEATPSAAWTMSPDSATPPTAPDQALAAPAAPATPATLPSGDWTIALDPQAPDGWSEPFEMISPEHLTDAPPSGPVPAAVAPPAPRDPVPKRPTPRPDVLPLVEPKVQIDPTLIEPLKPIEVAPPLRPMPPDAPLGPMPLDNPFQHAPSSSVDMPSYGPPPGAVDPAPPLTNLRPPPLQPSPFVMQHGQPTAHTGEAPAYPMDPSYQMVPVPGLPAPEPLTAAGSGLGDPYSSETALPVRTGRRRAIIVIVSALVAVVIGIVLLLLFGGKHAAGTPPGTAVDKAPSMPVEPKPTEPTTSPPAPTNAGPSATAAPPPNPAPDRPANAPLNLPDPAPATPKPSTASPAPAAGNATAAGSNAVASAVSPEASTCFAEVSSAPAGAEIVIDQTNVIGTTPQKVTLPCGNPVELVIRKGHFVPSVQTITPTTDGMKIKVVLIKPTFQVKVSSTPAGATITMNGKSLGVTPTMIKIPAFEASALIITKDGYATETENVTPKSNGVAVHSTLKKLDRKKPR